jgi:hypothetical protein
MDRNSDAFDDARWRGSDYDVMGDTWCYDGDDGDW